MFRSLLLDGNNTLEESHSVSSRRPEIMGNMSRALSEYGAPCSPDFLLDEYRAFALEFGSYPWENHPIFWRSILRRLNPAADVSAAQIRAVFSAYLHEYSERCSIYEDVLPFLSAQSRVRQMAFIANGNADRLDAFLSQFDLRRFFSVLVLSGETPQEKPHSFLFRYAVSRLGSHPSQCLMIGDRHDTDVMGAREQGIPTARISRPNSPAASTGSVGCCPDAEIRSLSELTQVLDSELWMEWPPALLGQVATPVTNAVLLAGGRGRRLEPVTTSRQKCTVEFGGVPMLDYTLRCLASVGCRNVLLVVDHREEDVRRVAGDGGAFGLDVEYVRGPFPCTLAATVACAKRLPGPFLYLHGNILFPPRLLEHLCALFAASGHDTVALVPGGATVQHARMVASSEGEVTQVYFPSDSAPIETESSLFLGAAVYQPGSILACSALANHMTEIAVERRLAVGGSVRAFVYRGPWFHLESLDDYRSAADRTPAQIVWGV